MNYKLDTMAGSVFSNVAEKAKNIATEKQVTVEFEFNGITCLVDETTNLDWLYRDYSNGHIMEWGTVGSNCVAEYDDGTKEELQRRNVESELRAEQRRAEMKRKEDEERTLFNKKVEDIKIELKDEDGWAKSRAANTSPYGKAALDYAEGWAKLMQVEVAKGKTVIECAEYTSHELGFFGITGFMYGCAVSLLSQCWEHGEELRKWHNKDYGHKGEGVVNPAVLKVG